MKPVTPLFAIGDGRYVKLLTPAEFEQVPEGTELLTINGRTLVKGVDYCDDDTRWGFLAYGPEVFDGE